MMLVSQVDESKDEADELKKMFELFDKDHNQFISKEELREGLSKLGEQLSEKDLE